MKRLGRSLFLGLIVLALVGVGVAQACPWIPPTPPPPPTTPPPTTVTPPPPATPEPPTSPKKPEKKEAYKVPMPEPKAQCHMFHLLATQQKDGTARLNIVDIPVKGSKIILTQKVAGNSYQGDIHPKNCKLAQIVNSDGQEFGDVFIGQMYDDGAYRVVNVTNTQAVDESYPQWIDDFTLVFLATRDGKTDVVAKSLAGETTVLVEGTKASVLAVHPYSDTIAFAEGTTITYWKIGTGVIATSEASETVTSLEWNSADYLLVNDQAPTTRYNEAVRIWYEEPPAREISIALDGKVNAGVIEGEVWSLDQYLRPIEQLTNVTGLEKGFIYSELDKWSPPDNK